MHNMTEDRSGAASGSTSLLIRAAVIALVLGTILTLFNQWPAITGKVSVQWLPLALVYITPFIVVALSQLLGIRAARHEAVPTSEHREGFGTTLGSHGIPGRALALGFAIGGVNTAIVAADNMLAGRDLAQLPVALVLQALILPVLFGALSQAIAFRRAIHTLGAKEITERMSRA